VAPLTVPKPALAIRVGVTGHRLGKLDAANIPQLRERAREVLGAIAEDMRRIAAGERDHHLPDKVADVYAHAEHEHPKAELRLLSPLAEGADRVVAAAALELGYTLEVPLPFAQAEYERDFPDTVDEFRDLLGKASAVFVLDGDRAEATRSYEAAGRFIVRNCDLLVAIWDGETAAGRGGTGEIVTFAATWGVPAWWIDAKKPATTPRILRTLRDLQHPPVLDAETTAKALTRYIERMTLPPRPPDEKHETALAWFGRKVGREDRPLRDYLRRTRLPFKWPWWRANAWLMKFLAPVKPAPYVSMLPPEGPTEKWWESLYAPADALSGAYGDRIRSSYILVIALAGIAVLTAVIAADPSSSDLQRRAGVLVELAALLTITILVIASYAQQWHSRWITYRLLAELCRKQRTLAPLGRTLPRRQVELFEMGDSLDEVPRDAWVSWYFSAAQRASAMPSGSLAQNVARAKNVGLSLVHEQTAYHQAREKRYKRAGVRLQHLGEIFFLLTLVGVIAECWLRFSGVTAEGWIKWIDLGAALLPAGAAAFVSLRAYSEFELLHDQSKRMQRVLRDAGEELEAVDVTSSAPLTSIELGSALHALAMAMMQDIGGWVQLFGIKGLETG
jgi:hypothetical protein